MLCWVYVMHVYAHLLRSCGSLVCLCVEMRFEPEQMEDGGVTEQEEQTEEEEMEGVMEDEGEDDEDEGLAEDWDEETGSMSPTDAGEIKAVMLPLEDPICYHCGAALVDPPLILSSEPASLPASALPSPSAKISIPLHCEVCARGIHSQCHIALGGALPTQEESFVCFHCRTSQHGKYAMKAADRARVSVGPAHQVPKIPDIFFNNDTYKLVRERFVAVWCADAGKLIPDSILNEYLHKSCANWPDRLRVNSSGGSLAPGSIRRLYLPRAATYNTPSILNHYWCPFSHEYALSVLHKSNYDCQTGLSVLQNPLLRDCFTHACAPPTKPYYNKWKPKDRRWRMMKIPFPPHRTEAPMMNNNEEDNNVGPRLRSRRYLY